MNDNGKQITVHLNTVAYEILKNHALPLLSSFGTVSLINPSVVTADLDNSTIEAQNYICLNDDGFNVSLTFYHTTCNMSIQSYKNAEMFLMDGKHPVVAFYQKYLYPATQIIVDKTDMQTES